jgi:hypothetical protein
VSDHWEQYFACICLPGANEAIFIAGVNLGFTEAKAADVLHLLLLFQGFGGIQDMVLGKIDQGLTRL